MIFSYICLKNENSLLVPRLEAFEVLHNAVDYRLLLRGRSQSHLLSMCFVDFLRLRRQLFKRRTYSLESYSLEFTDRFCVRTLVSLLSEASSLSLGINLLLSASLPLCLLIVRKRLLKGTLY